MDMKLNRTLRTAPIAIAALVLMTVTNACTVTPPSAVNPPTPTQATAEAATPDPVPLPALPPGRAPRQIETPISVEITTTRAPAKTVQPPTLVFQWRGGFVGRNDLWTIYANGQIRNNKDQLFVVPPETVTALMQQLDSLGFYDFQDRYEAACNDCFEYTIYAYKNGERKAVYAIDNGSLPAPLMQAVKAIQDIVAPTT